MMTAGPAPLTPVPMVVKMPPPIIVPSPIETRSFAVRARRRILRVPSSRSFVASVVANSSDRNDIPASFRSARRADLRFGRFIRWVPEMIRSAERVVDPARPHEERVGEAVEKAQCGVAGSVLALPQRDGEALGAAADRPRELQPRAGKRSAGMDEVRQRREIALGLVDGALQRVDVGS